MSRRVESQLQYNRRMQAALDQLVIRVESRLLTLRYDIEILANDDALSQLRRVLPPFQ